MSRRPMSRAEPTNKQLDVLVTVAWAMHHFGGGLTTSAQLPRRTMLRLHWLGLVRETEPCAQCDGDGFVIENRVWRKAWRLTRAGWEAARAWDRDGTEEYAASVESILAVDPAGRQSDQRGVPTLHIVQVKGEVATAGETALILGGGAS
jgi:hypothetical protein